MWEGRDERAFKRRGCVFHALSHKMSPAQDQHTSSRLCYPWRYPGTSVVFLWRPEHPL